MANGFYIDFYAMQLVLNQIGYGMSHVDNDNGVVVFTLERTDPDSVLPNPLTILKPDHNGADSTYHYEKQYVIDLLNLIVTSNEEIERLLNDAIVRIRASRMQE